MEKEEQKILASLPNCIEVSKIADASTTNVYVCKFVKKSTTDPTTTLFKYYKKVYKVCAHPINEHTHQCKNIQREFLILSKLQHENINKVYRQSQIQFKKENIEMCYLSSKFCDRDLYKEIKNKFPEITPMAQFRQWFLQVAKAMQYLHITKNICHLDIKPENIVINRKNKAKLIDFGLSSQAEGLDKRSVYELWRKRTKLYQPPEVIDLVDTIKKIRQNRKKYDSLPESVVEIDWKKVDIFQLGVTMFNAMFLQSPFQQNVANVNDKYYQYIIKKKYEEFWSCDNQFIVMAQNIEQQKDHRISEMRDLLQKMIVVDPSQRLTIDQVIEHPFFAEKEAPKQ